MEVDLRDTFSLGLVGTFMFLPLLFIVITQV